MPNSLWPHRVLCPWESPGKKTGVDCNFLPQGIFPTQRPNQHLLYCRKILCRLTHLGSSSVTLAATPLQSCPTLCDPIDGSPPGSPVPGTLQARTLEWVAISFSNVWKWKVKVKYSIVSNSYFFANTFEYFYFCLTYNKLCRIRTVFIVLLHPHRS